MTRSDIFSGLNDPQREAVDFGEGPLLVLAGAGSGKTRVVTLRIVRLIERGIDPRHILGVTFTNKAAAEMRDRVQRSCQSDVLISTFHSLGVRMLRESIHHLGYRRDFTIYDEDDVEKVVKTCADDLGLACERSDLKNFRTLISRTKNALQSPDALDLPGLRGMQSRILPNILRAYTEKLFQYNAVDFDDLLYLPVRLLRDHDEVLSYYQQRWHYLLIDEYQDTNVAQYELIRLLVEHHRNLCVVGDPDQSIYSWRGAEIRNILDFQQDYSDAKVIRLEQNYRSTTHILDAANGLIANNHSRYEKDLWSSLGAGEKVGIYVGNDELDETRFVAQCIRYHNQNDAIPLDRMAILYRTNFQSRAFEDRLLAMRIPYVVIGGVSFYQRREIKDIMAYLRVVQSSSDVVSFQRTIVAPKRGLGAQTLEKIRLGAETEQVPLLDYCKGLLRGSYGSNALTAKQSKALAAYVELIDDLRKQRDQRLLKDLVQATISLSGYLGYLQQDMETYQDREANLEELVSKASEWQEQNPQGNLATFLEELSLKSNADDLDVEQPRVSLMSLHSGKGLEFPVVFLVGMEEDLFPHINSRESEVGLEEERRLCYVGITRAQRYLYTTRVRSRNLWGTRRTMHASRFLNELPKAHVRQLAQPMETKAVADEEEEDNGFGERIEYDEPISTESKADFSVNDVVFHREFGIGKIESVYQGAAGLTYKVFFTKDQKAHSLVARLAALSKLK